MSVRQFYLLRSEPVYSQFPGPQYNGSVDDFLFDGQEVSLSYVFDEDGKLVKGALVKKNNAKYYIVAGVIQFGWFNIDGDWYYFDGVRDYKYYGKALTGNWTRNSQRYVCDSSGKLTKGFLYRDAHGTKYLWAGQPVTGWCDVNGVDWSNKSLKGKCYIDPETEYIVTSSVELDGKTYYFNDNGIIKEGWISEPEGTVCYDGGLRVSGWVNANNSKYYFDPNNNCVMVTDKVEIGGLTYYFNEDGTIKDGYYKTNNVDTRYYEDGIMLSGWVTIDGYQHYFDPDNDCIMATDTAVIDGEIYAFSNVGYFRHMGAHEDLDNDGECDKCANSITDIIKQFISIVQQIVELYQKVVKIISALNGIM